MSDLPEQALHQQLHARPISGEQLEIFGKKAAADWSNGTHDTLTAAVTATVKEAQLSPEQVKRVVEFANTAAYLSEFRKEGATHKVIDFEGGPADFSEILKDLNDGGGGSLYDRGTLDYASPPPEVKHASAQDEQALFAEFGSPAPALPFENPYAEVIDLKAKLAGAAEHVGTQISGLEIMYADLSDQLYHQVKQASLSDVSFGKIAQAWAAVAPTREYVKVATNLFTPRLLREGVFSSLDALLASADKTASAGLLNVEHPLVTGFQEFCEVVEKLATLRATRAELRENEAKLASFLKIGFDSGEMSTLAKGWHAATSKSEEASKVVRPFLDKHVGKTVGALGATAVKYAPHVGAAFAANEVNQHIENSPSLPARGAKAVKHGILAQIPGTEDNIRKKWELQSGQ